MRRLEDPKIVRELQKGKIHYGNSWEQGSAYLFDSIRAYEDLAAALLLTDSNDLIVSMRDIIPLVAGELTRVQRKDLALKVSKHLKDTRMCDITYRGFQADEEDTTTIAETAVHTLDYLKKLN